MPNQSGFVYLVTNRLGQYRLVIISRPTINGEMFGIMTTLQVGRGSNLFPVSAPISMDLPVLAFTFSVALAVGGLLSLAPCMTSSLFDIHATLKAGSRVAGPQAGRQRRDS